jgi:hypothetical protein
LPEELVARDTRRCFGRLLRLSGELPHVDGPELERQLVRHRKALHEARIGR